ARLSADELVLIADFGGGTTDLCLVDVGPSWRKGNALDRVRASDGIGLAGDAIDQRIIKHAIAPQLGLGTKYKVMGGDADVPRWLYNSLSRWHHLSFLKAPATMRLLDDILENAYAPKAVEALYRIVDEDLGYALHRAVEKAKVELSNAAEARIDFEDVHCTVTRSDLETWIEPDLEAIANVIDRVLAKAGVSAEAVDRVFMTGGTSLVPAVRALFAGRFGANKLRGGDEMTTVGRGLALAARDTFAP
ncbi:MAG: Hsp70 family protein, partial [Clostridia bacterium]|nr:Hsp70 family protein [Deltaproteobacteria bacterium]